MTRVWIIATIGLSACFDFGLDDRQFRCDRDPEICGVDMVCGPTGSCVPDEGQESCGNGVDDDGDGLVDCADDDCGQASCADGNPCTIDTCVSDGVCDNEPSSVPSCGNGCICDAGIAREISCFDMIDNDGDELIDCLDDDCAMCAADLQCCADGACRPSC